VTYEAVLLALVARLEADADLLGLLGGPHVYRSGAHREKRVPSVEWFVVSEVLRENTFRLLIQWDIWAHSYGRAAAIDRRLRRILHREVPHTVGGVLMWMQVESARDVPDPEPSLVHRALDMSFEPAREI
jgi:hypothetical protein